MSSKINRRSFLSRIALGTGAVAFGTLAPFNQIYGSTQIHTKEKKLFASTDFVPNVSSHGFYDRAMLDDLHKHLASLGVTRHQWIVDIDRDPDLYDEYQPPGFDILAEAIDSAHAHGLEFYGLIKLTESGGRWAVPNTLPFPEDPPVAAKDLRGIFIRCSPFLAQNPHMSMKRRPGTYEVRGPVSSIRLVKGDDQPTRIRDEHLSIWTSSTNNQYKEYKGPVSFDETIEWRPIYRFGGTGGRSVSRLHRVLHLNGLQIPEDHRYILIRCSLADEQGDFTNERGYLVELSGPQQENMPCMLSTGPSRYNPQSFQTTRASLQRYLQHPDVRAELLDPRKGAEHYRDYYSFGETSITRPYTLDREGYVAIACGKPEYLLGTLHPIYPEVREHWLDTVRYCLDRGVDGINFRHNSHVRSSEYWEYGFNEPVLEATGGKTDYPSIWRVNGEAYTQFLREARDVIKSRGKGITIHLFTGILMGDDRPGALHWYPPNILYTHWETWVREIADDLELRGVHALRPWNLQKAIDIFSSVTSAAGKPLYYQSNHHELGAAERGSDRTDDRESHHYVRQEMERVQADPRFDGYVLYETDVFTRKNEEGRIVGRSNALKELIKSHWL